MRIAILAFLPEEELQAKLDKIEFTRHTPKTVRTVDGLCKQLAEVRKVGYALDRAELIEGVNCAAAPVFDRRNRPVASITVTGTGFRLSDEQLPEIGRIVREHCNQITERLSGVS